MPGAAFAAVDLTGRGRSVQTLPTVMGDRAEWNDALGHCRWHAQIAGTIDPGANGAFQVISPSTPCPVAVVATATPEQQLVQRNVHGDDGLVSRRAPNLHLCPELHPGSYRLSRRNCPGDDPCPAGAQSPSTR